MTKQKSKHPKGVHGCLSVHGQVGKVSPTFLFILKLAADQFALGVPMQEPRDSEGAECYWGAVSR